nr:hypothetical protein [Caulobacter sp. S6]
MQRSQRAIIGERLQPTALELPKPDRVEAVGQGSCAAGPRGQHAHILREERDDMVLVVLPLPQGDAAALQIKIGKAEEHLA